VSGSQFLIGRDPQCNLRPSSPVISNRHCAILIREDSAHIRDLMSTNGTFVNGKKVEDEVELRDQDQLVVGPLKLGVRLEVPERVKVHVPPKNGIDAAHKNGDDDDEAASLLLAMVDDISGAVQGELATESDIAAGTTVLGIPSPAAVANGTDEKKEQTQLEKIKQAQADTSSAAAAILSKYMRRR
jgi:pSer/pThr/pTyr-binding forkhead associated (FHA) protein